MEGITFIDSFVEAENPRLLQIGYAVRCRPKGHIMVDTEIHQKQDGSVIMPTCFECEIDALQGNPSEEAVQWKFEKDMEEMRTRSGYLVTLPDKQGKSHFIPSRRNKL